MQGLGVVTTENLLQRGQQPLLKLEIFVDPNWINVSDWFSYILSACDATTDWTGTARSIDNADYKEGSGSLKDTDAAPADPNWYPTTYNPTGTWDLSNNTHVLCWLKCNRPSTAFTSAQLRLYDSTGKYRYWNLTFLAGEWTAVKKLLATGNGVGGGGAPDLTIITSVAITFQAADGVAFYKKIDYLRIDDSPVGEASGDFLETCSISFAGAGMSPNPIAATLSAEINNEGAQLHPKHPSSLYTDFFRVGRKVRISVGAKYGGVDCYWQRIIGDIDAPKFEGKTFKLTITGLDYTRALADTIFKKTAVPPDNYWGGVATFDTAATEGTLGNEKYNEVDAMDINNEDPNVDEWTPTNCAFDSQADAGAPSGTHVGKMTMAAPADTPVVKNPEVATVTIGLKYKVKFHYKRLSGSAISVLIYQTVGGADRICGGKYNLSASSYTAATFYFTALKTGPIAMWIVYADLTNGQFRIDKISIKKSTDPPENPYGLPAACTGVFYVELDADDDGNWLPVWPGKQKGEGWYYDPVTRYFFFDEDKDIEAGTANLKVYYFTQQAPEDVVADILVFAGHYANQADALTAMGDPATGITIDQVWFDAGSSFLKAIKMLCERCDYRFYFKYDGTPVFAGLASPKLQDFEDLVFDRYHIADPEYYEDRNEIRNRVVIEGLKQALPEGAEETVPSELKKEEYNQASIDEYGEHTLSIKNHLFQDQDSINNMCKTLLARYKDPMWYLNFDTPFNPAPLEIWDTIAAILLLKSADIHGSKYETFKYDSGTKYGCGEIAVGVRGLIRDIKINKYNITYKCEEV